MLPDLKPGNSTINAKVGEQLTVEQCLYAILLASANEVCTQMAVRVAGSVSNFTALMNEKAAELGCENTHFVNANGLPDPNHYTTAHDLARILAAAVANEDFCRISGSSKYTIPATNLTDTPRDLTNTHILIEDGPDHYPGVLAGKTGHTEAAKNTLVTAAKRDDMTLICVVMRSDGDHRFTDTAALLDYGFQEFHMLPVHWMDEENPAGYAVL
ncbi:serine-type D-Ala-D-Ala carboxypeptidase, partial [gut metagenome]